MGRGGEGKKEGGKGVVCGGSCDGLSFFICKTMIVSFTV